MLQLLGRTNAGRAPRFFGSFSTASELALAMEYLPPEKGWADLRDVLEVLQDWGDHVGNEDEQENDEEAASKRIRRQLSALPVSIREFGWIVGANLYRVIDFLLDHVRAFEPSDLQFMVCIAGGGDSSDSGGVRVVDMEHFRPIEMLRAGDYSKNGPGEIAETVEEKWFEEDPDFGDLTGTGTAAGRNDQSSGEVDSSPRTLVEVLLQRRAISVIGEGVGVKRRRLNSKTRLTRNPPCEEHKQIARARMREQVAFRPKTDANGVFLY